jgi:hypothetical protein
MKSGQILPEDPKKNKQSGQTLVEFALLLLVIATISFGFIAVTNRNLAKYWTAYARLIVDDPSQDGIINL